MRVILAAILNELHFMRNLEDNSFNILLFAFPREKV